MALRDVFDEIDDDHSGYLVNAIQLKSMLHKLSKKNESWFGSAQEHAEIAKAAEQFMKRLAHIPDDQVSKKLYMWVGFYCFQ
jgi:SET domain-containing protein